ncbi:MAG: ABC transporter substrate-binding protein [Acidilobaceae archaeon]
MMTNIVYGSLPVLTSLPIHIAHREGLFEKNGLRLELVKFQSAAEKNKAFLSGELNAMESDTVTTIIIASLGYKAKALTHYLVEFSLVAAPGVKVRDVKSIAVSMKTVTEWSAHDLLQRELGLDPSTYRFVDVQKIPERFKLLIERGVDAAVLPEPWATIALSRGASLIAKKFTECCMDVFSVDVLSDEVAEAFMKSVKEALKRLKESPDRFFKILAEETTLPAEALSLKVFDLLFREDYVRTSFPRSLFEDISKWTLRRGYIEKMSNYEDVFYIWRKSRGSIFEVD